LIFLLWAIQGISEPRFSVLRGTGLSIVEIMKNSVDNAIRSGHFFLPSRYSRGNRLF